MNERIQELIYNFNNEVGVMWANEDKLKFAELIIRECCQCEKSYGGDAGLVARSFSRKIKEHFGLEP